MLANKRIITLEYIQNVQVYTGVYVCVCYAVAGDVGVNTEMILGICEVLLCVYAHSNKESLLKGVGLLPRQ